MTSPNSLVAEILNTYRLRGQAWIGGVLTVHEHALQCASLALKAGESNAIVGACLLHRYGYVLRTARLHRTVPLSDAALDLLGANRLAAVFGPEVVEPIRLQTDALRYLCWENPAYLGRNREAVPIAPPVAGGPMTDSEALEFEVHPHCAAALRVRRYNDLGRDANLVIPRLESFHPLLLGLVHAGTESRPKADPRRTTPGAELPMRDLAWCAEP